MLKVKLLASHATPPAAQHPGEDLAYDIYALERTVLLPFEPVKVRTGVAAVFTPEIGHPYQNYGLLIRDRSSMAAKGIATLGGVVDSGYRGEILVVMVLLANAGAAYTISAGDKIAQMLPVPVLTAGGVEVVAELPPATRGARGFGSSGR